MLGLSSRAAALSVAVGAALGLLYVWGPWREADPCTTLDKGMRACLPVVVVPPPLVTPIGTPVGQNTRGRKERALRQPDLL